MSNQKKHIADLNLAHHGYDTGVPLTVKDIDDKVIKLAANLNNVKTWEQDISKLLTIPLDEFVNMQYDCCLVTFSVFDFPVDLLDIDSSAYVFTNRSENSGIQTLIGAQSGIIATRRLNNGKLTPWTPTQGHTIYYATFDINPSTGMLEMHTDPGYTGANFNIENGNLTVTI